MQSSLTSTVCHAETFLGIYCLNPRTSISFRVAVPVGMDVTEEQHQRSNDNARSIDHDLRPMTRLRKETCIDSCR